jgi:invasion protein IalB
MHASKRVFSGLTIAMLVIAQLIVTVSAQTNMSKSSDQNAAQKKEKTPSTAVSSDPTATTAAFGDWTLRCAKVDSAGTTKVCEITQSFTPQGQTAPLAQIALGRTASNEPLKFTLVLPNNVTLTFLPQVFSDPEIEAQGLQLSWLRCLPGGCFAGAPVQGDEMTKWLAATKSGAIVFADGTGQKLKLPLSFRGLQQALDSLGDK